MARILMLLAAGCGYAQTLTLEDCVRLAIAVIGGGLVSMILSLLITPALFSVLRERGSSG